jgi:hypothetical protein
MESTMDTVNWMRLERTRAQASRSVLWRHTAPLALAAGAALFAWLPADEASTRPAVAALVAALGLAFAVVDAPAARRSFTARHQREVLPALFAHAGVSLSAAPMADPPWILCDRTGLFPATAEKARPTPVFHGDVDGTPVEACAFVLTRTRVKRKVRKIDVPVFDGAVFAASLAPGAQGGALWLGRRAGWAPRKAFAGLRRAGGWLPWSVRTYTSGKPGWSPAALAPVSAFLAMYPKAAVSLVDGRHLVVVVPGAGSIFRPSWPWVSVGHDRRGARAVEMARAVAAMARSLGGSSSAAAVVAPTSAVDTPDANPFAVVPVGATTPLEAPVVAVDSLAPGAALPGVLPPVPVLGAASPRPGRMVAARVARGGLVSARTAASALAGWVSSTWNELRATGPAQRLEEVGMDRWDALRGRLGVAVPEPTMSVRPVGPAVEPLRKEPVVTAPARPAAPVEPVGAPPVAAVPPLRRDAASIPPAPVVLAKPDGSVAPASDAETDQGPSGPHGPSPFAR